MYNELSYTAHEVVTSLSIDAAAILGGWAVKRQAENRGLEKPLPKLLGTIAAVGIFVLGDKLAAAFSPDKASGYAIVPPAEEAQPLA